MKKLLLILLCLPFIGFGQNISTARMQSLGTTVTISGIVTNGDELGSIRYIEDSTAGLAIYDFGLTVIGNVVRGELITISGVLADYNGLLQLQQVNSLTSYSTGNFISPQIVTPLQIGESTEGELVQIDNVIFNNTLLK